MRSKRLLAIAAGLLLVVALVVVAIPRIDINSYREPIQKMLTTALGRDVSIGRMYLNVWPLGVRVDQVAIGDDPAFRSPNPFARVGTLYVSPRVLPLLRGGFELRALELRTPVIELIRNAAGRWNVESLGGGSKDSSSSTLTLGRLRITRGQVAITDRYQPGRTRAATSAAERTVYRNIDVQIDGFETGRAFQMALATTLPGTGTQRVSVEGTVGPLATDAAATPFDGRAQFDGASLSGLAQFAGATASLDGSDATLTGRIDLKTQSGRTRATGALQLTDVRVRKTDLGYAIAADLDVAYDTASGRAAIERGALRLGTMPVSITGSVETGAARPGGAGANTAGVSADSPVLDLHVVASDVSMSEAARLAAAAGVAFGTKTRVDGRLQADVHARGPANRATLDGQLRLRDVSISGPDIPRPVRTPALDLALTPDAVRSNAFVASVDQTSIGARFAIGRYTSATPTVDASLTAKDADVANLLSIARAFGVEAVDGVQGSGRLTLDVRATGASDALQYTGSGSLTNAAFTTPSLTKPFRIPHAALMFASDAMSLDNLQMALGKTTADGRLTVRRFTAPVVDFQLSANTLDVVEMQAVLAPVSATSRAATSRAAAPRPTAAASASAPSGDSLLRLTTGSGRLRFGSITNDGLVLEDVQATATLDRGVMRLDPLTASVYGGQHRGAIVVDASRTPATFSMTSSLDQVDANKLTSATTSLRDVLYGALASSLQVSASTNGVDSIAKSLNGTLSLNLPNGRLAKMDLLQEAASIGRFVTGRPRADKSTPVAALTGTFTVTNGVARTDDLSATLDGGMLGATGTINLVDDSVNMRLALVLSREASQQAGGSRIGGLMTTALSNDRGEIVVPMMLTGTMSQPRFAPDAQRFAEMRTKNLIPSLLSPGTLKDRLLGGLTGRKPADAPPAPAGTAAAPTTGDASAPPTTETVAPAPVAAPKPVERVQDALRGLLRRRTPPPTQPEAAPAPAQPEGAGK